MAEGSEDDLDSSQLEGRYANYFKIGYNAFEFLLDFGQSYEDPERARIHTRIVIGPAYARVLLEMLQRSVASFESVHGRAPEAPEGRPH
jgi:hypothetical protein